MFLQKEIKVRWGNDPEKCQRRCLQEQVPKGIILTPALHDQTFWEGWAKPIETEEKILIF